MAEYTLLSPHTITIEKNVKIAKGVYIYPNNHLLEGTEIAEGTILFPNNTLKNVKIGKNCTIKNSFLQDCTVGDNCSIGPFANLHSHSVIGSQCRIGNFVEIKNSQIAEKVKIAHLAYVGDATIQENCNIGCGVVFCNYNGIEKKGIFIEKNCFIGSNVNLIAPLTIAAGSYICAGTTVAKDIEQRACVIGRVKQQQLPHLVEKYCKEEK